MKFLEKLRERGEREKKDVIWGGDFNVNPNLDDWSMRAFDQIRHKIKKGTKPAGCREQDREAYRCMLAAVRGRNVGEIFSRGKPKRTCFPNERSLTLILDKELTM